MFEYEINVLYVSNIKSYASGKQASILEAVDENIKKFPIKVQNVLWEEFCDSVLYAIGDLTEMPKIPLETFADIVECVFRLDVRDFIEQLPTDEEETLISFEGLVGSMDDESVQCFDSWMSITEKVAKNEGGVLTNVVQKLTFAAKNNVELTPEIISDTFKEEIEKDLQHK